MRRRRLAGRLASARFAPDARVAAIVARHGRILPAGWSGRKCWLLHHLGPCYGPQRPRMSSRVKQYIWAAAILMIAFVFIIGFRPGAQLQQMGGTGTGPTCAVENDGRCIVSQSDFVTAFRLTAGGQLDTDELRDAARQMVVEGLIQRWLLL